MINTIHTYRRFIASLLACWMSLIVISGIVFMHKEVTSKGEIITHVHPYDFTQKQKHHHDTDAEIHYLDILFHGSFIESVFVNYEIPFINEFIQEFLFSAISQYTATPLFYSYLRGPPILVQYS